MTPWALILDIVPILLFIVWYIWLYTRNVLDVSPAMTTASAVAFLVATVIALQYSHVLHGALVYTPGLLAVVLLAVAHAREQRAERVTLLIAAGVYAAASYFAPLTGRSVPSSRSERTSCGTA